MKYRREIDGLRAIAVLPVIFFHGGNTLFSGGYVGVDVFFVISGYLITSIIVAEKQSGTFTIKNFYERRARRILPALFLVVAICLPFAWAWMSPTQLAAFSQSIAAVSLFSSNFLFWLESGYFAPAAELKPLLHTWSLAVEEQYYILFPLFVLVTWRFGIKAIFASLLVIGSASLLLAQWSSAYYPNANFYLLPTRLWELLIGSLIAIYLLKRESLEAGSTGKTFLREQFFSCLGLAFILYSIFFFNDQTPFPGFYALLPTAGTALIILFASKGTLVTRILSHKLPVGIGLVSYSAYLWHQPMFAFARLRSINEPSHSLMLLLGFLALALAYLSWRFVEQPYRDKTKYSRRQIFYRAGLATVAVVGLGLWGQLNGGFSSRTIATGVTYAETDLDERVRINFGFNQVCELGLIDHEDCRNSDQPEILVWGDSFAMHLVQGVLASNSEAGVIQITKSVCGPIIGLAPVNKLFPENWSEECLEYNDSVAQWIKENTSLHYAVLSSPFNQYLTDEWKIMTAEGVLGPDESVVYEYFISTLEFLILQGIQPVVFAPPPFIGDERDMGACLVRASIFGEDLSLCDFSYSRYRDKQRDVINFLEKIDQEYRVIWMDDYLCDRDTCKAAEEDVFIYRDWAHLSYEGSALVGSRMNFKKLISTPD